MNTNLRAPAMVERGTYGFATEAVNRLLVLASQFQFFRPVTTISAGVHNTLNEHLDLYEAFTNNAPQRHSAVVLGDGTVLRQLRADVVAGPGSEEHSGAWAANLGRHLHRLIDGAPSSLFKPPLWPVQGLSNVVTQLVIHSRETVLQSVSTDDCETFWEVACDVEDLFWNAIQWEVLHSSQPKPNPFLPLVELARQGLYAIGFWRDVFIVFGRAVT